MKVYAVSPKSKNNLEDRAVSILNDFSPKNLSSPMALDVERLIDVYLEKKYGWGLDVWDNLPPDILGFSDPKNKSIVVSLDTLNGITNGDGRCRFTGCHEFSHVELHRNQMQQRMVTFNPKSEYLFREKRSEIKTYQDPEWQADYMAGALLMPKKMVQKLKNEHVGWFFVEKMMEVFKVSKSAAEIRLKKLGILE